MGKGELGKKIDNWIQELEIQEYVKIIDYSDNPFSYYRVATILAMTSETEGLPNVLLEGMLLGVPIVAVDCLAGPRELLKESIDYSEHTLKYEICKNGILVEHTDTDETGETDYFAQAMDILLQDKDLRDQLISNSKATMEKYSNEIILDQWKQLIENTKRKEQKLQHCNEYRKIIVYGAGMYGKLTMLSYLENREDYELLCFAVSNKDNCNEKIFDIPVYQIEELVKEREEALVIIGVSHQFEDEIIMKLEEYGFQYSYPIL